MTWGDRPTGICEASGRKFPLSELVRQWDGAMVHYRFVDKRNPQDFVRGRKERIALPNARPEPPDAFVALPLVGIDGPFLISQEGRGLFSRGPAQ